jgi:hypothetical protein
LLPREEPFSAASSFEAPYSLGKRQARNIIDPTVRAYACHWSFAIVVGLGGTAIHLFHKPTSSRHADCDLV